MELKLCPFCGGKATSYNNDVFGCSSCDCWVDTVEEWNRRDYPDLRKTVEEVEEEGNYYDGNDADDDLDIAYGKGLKEAAKRFKQLLEEELSDTTR